MDVTFDRHRHHNTTQHWHMQITCSMLQPSYQVSKQHNSLGHVLRAKVHTISSVSTSHYGSLLYLTDPILFRHWHVWAQKLQTEQSAFQTKTPNDKRHHSAERAWFGALSLCLLALGSGRLSVAKCCSLSEHFSPGGLICAHFQNRVAGDESAAPRNLPSIPDTRAPFSPSYPEYLLSCGIKLTTCQLRSNKVFHFFLSYGDTNKFLVDQ